MEKVESDLNHSKQLREKQTREFQKQLQEEKYRYEQQVSGERLDVWSEVGVLCIVKTGSAQ